MRWLSGSPFTVQAGVDLDGDGQTQSDRPANLPITVGMGDVNAQLAMINAFRASRNLPPVNGALLDLDQYLSLDLRLTKQIGLGSTRRVDLFIEAYNVTNHVNFNPERHRQHGVDRVPVTHLGERPASDPVGVPIWVLMKKIRSVRAFRVFAGSFPCGNRALVRRHPRNNPRRRHRCRISRTRRTPTRASTRSRATAPAATTPARTAPPIATR